MWFLKKKKVGLALGSGGAKGVAHVGVIKSLLKNGIPIDFIAGSSAGAFVGALFASRGDVSELEKMIREISYKDLGNIFGDPVLNGGLIKGERTLTYLRQLFDGEKIEDLRIPFSAVMTDIKTAETVAEAVRASISVPLVYSPVMLQGSLMVDGGVSSPVPVEVAREMGADVVIAVNLDGVYFSERKDKDDFSGSTIGVLKNSYFALRYNLSKKEVAGAEIVIEPQLKNIGEFNFVGSTDGIIVGEEATDREIQRIKKLL
jgi:NTE family protein